MSRGRFNAGRSVVSRGDVFAGPVIWRLRIWVAASCRMAREDALEACMTVMDVDVTEGRERED